MVVDNTRQLMASERIKALEERLAYTKSLIDDGWSLADKMGIDLAKRLHELAGSLGLVAQLEPQRETVMVVCAFMLNSITHATIAREIELLKKLEGST